MSKSAEELELAKEVAKKAKQLALEREAKLLSTIRAEFYVQLSEVLKSGKVEFAVWHTGLGKPAISLGNANDLYLDTRSGDVFAKDGGAWVLALNIKGSDGRDGRDGEKGDRGERGATGLAGKNGSDGKDGKNGKDGRDGKDGRNGVDGARGKDGKNGSKWFSRRGTPNYSLGSVGDFYLEEATGKYYEKTTNLKWELRGSLRGPSGPTGLVGPAGQGVPSGGTAGQILAKLNGSDYATEWVDNVGGVPDEAYNYIDLSDKIRGTVPASVPVPDAIIGAEGAMYWTRVGRTVRAVFMIIIPSSATWTDADPFFPINTIVMLEEDLPFLSRSYDQIGFSPFSIPGNFSLINTTDGDAYNVGNAVGSVVTDFGGSLSKNIMVFFNATEPSTGNLSNLLYDGNFIDIVGNTSVICGSIEYEAAYAEGFIDITGTLPSGNHSEAYDNDLTIVASSGYQYPFSIEVTEGALPAGLSASVSGSTITIDGTPTEDGIFTFTLTVTGDNGDEYSEEFTLTINGLPDGIGFSGDFTTDAYDNIAYSSMVNIDLDNEGLQLPVNYEVIAGSLPDGLSLALANDTELTLSGTPTVEGVFTFTIEVTDTNGATYSYEFTVTVNPYDPELEPLYLGSWSFGSRNLIFADGSPTQQMPDVYTGMVEGNILYIRTAGSYDFGIYSDGVVSGSVGEYLIFTGGKWEIYVY